MLFKQPVKVQCRHIRSNIYSFASLLVRVGWEIMLKSSVEEMLKATLMRCRKRREKALG